MKTTRKSIFETNSSSSHSLSLGSLTEEIVPDDTECQIVLGDGEYGWAYEDFGEWLDKADYITVDAGENSDRLELIESVIKEKYPKAQIKFVTDGYIDHDSDGTFWYSYGTRDEVRTFIFGDGGFSTGNDNDEGSQEY